MQVFATDQMDSEHSIPGTEQRIIAVMPLHAITAVYGERGLRTRLAMEIAQLEDAASGRRILEALQLAGRLHAADQRQREPYLNHYADVRVRPTWRRELLVAA